MDTGEELLGSSVTDAQPQTGRNQELLEFFVAGVRGEYELNEGASRVYWSHDVSGVDEAMTLHRLMKEEFPEQLVRVSGRKDGTLMWVEVIELLGITTHPDSPPSATWDKVEEDWQFARQFLDNSAFLDAWRSWPIDDFDEALSICDLLYSKYESDRVAFALRQHASSWTVAVRRPIENTESGT